MQSCGCHRSGWEPEVPPSPQGCCVNLCLGGESSASFPPQTHHSEHTQDSLHPSPWANPLHENMWKSGSFCGLCEERALPCAAPSQCLETAACPRAAFSSMDLHSPLNHAHSGYASRQLVLCTPNTPNALLGVASGQCQCPAASPGSGNHLGRAWAKSILTSCQHQAPDRSSNRKKYLTGAE